MNNKKYLLITDTHLSNNKIKTVIEFYEYLCSYAKENNIKELVHLGDFFSNRKYISLNLIPVVYQIGDMLNNTFNNVYIIAGNHDIFYKDRMDVTSLLLFRFYKNIHVITEPYQLSPQTLLYPWLFNKERLTIDKRTGYKNIMGHFDISGVVLNRSGTLSKNDNLSQSDFSGFENVFSGHFHTPGIYGNIRYLGAPYQMSFNDGGIRGFYIWDEKTLDFIEYNGYSKYIILTQDHDFNEGDIFNNNVRLDFTKKLPVNEMENLTKKINELKPKSFKTKFAINDVEKINGVDSPEIISDNRELLLTFFKNDDTPEHINKKLLESFLNVLIEEFQG